MSFDSVPIPGVGRENFAALTVNGRPAVAHHKFTDPLLVELSYRDHPELEGRENWMLLWYGDQQHTTYEFAVAGAVAQRLGAHDITADNLRAAQKLADVASTFEVLQRQSTDGVTGSALPATGQASGVTPVAATGFTGVTESWDTEWGPLTITYGGTGTWQQSDTRLGQIKSSAYNPATRTLTFAYYQDWNDSDGQGVLTIAPDGKSFTGMYQQRPAASAGAWTSDGSWTGVRATPSVLIQTTPGGRP